MKKVLITGSSRGIGLETALAFGRAGYQVFATLRNPDGASELKHKIKEEMLPITVHAMDVSSDHSVQSCIQGILKEYGSIDVLVNNAGIAPDGSVEEVPMEVFKSVMDTNYFGSIRCIKAVLPAMREKRSGCIINVSSIAGKIANTPLGPYSASKHALEAISEALAEEVKPFNIRVGIVEPGIIETDLAHAIVNEKSSLYPQVRRFGGLFAASLQTPTNASVVADKIVGIAESGSWQLRHPVGPDAIPFIGWRASMTDEEWINWNSVSDDEWYAAIERDFGLNARRG